MSRDPSNGSQTGVGDKRGPVRHGPAHPAESERAPRERGSCEGSERVGDGARAVGNNRETPGRSELGEGRFYIEKSN